MKIGQHKVFSGGNSTVRSVVIGIIVSAAISILLTLLLTSLVLDGKVGEDNVATPMFFVRMIAMFIGGMVATAVRKEKHLLTIGLVMLGYFILLSGICILLYDGTFNKMLSGILSIILGGAVSCLLRLKPTKNKWKMPKYTT